MTPRIIAALLVLAAHAAPENPAPDYLFYVVSLCAELYEVDAKLCRCIVNKESEWNPNARGDNGKAVGLWQWHEESIKVAFRDMGIVWGWAEGDPRLNVWASTLAACHSLSKGWRWWTTQDGCEGLGK